jgi:hypothetical protein
MAIRTQYVIHQLAFLPIAYGVLFHEMDNKGKCALLDQRAAVVMMMMMLLMLTLGSV